MKKSWIKTRILTIAALLLFSVVAPFGNAGTVSAAGFSGEGDGTESDPYVIMTPTQLDEVRNDLHAYYVLGADIDLSGYASWDPIGAFKEPFTGTFDGDGHTISNLKVYHKIGPNVFFASRVGLFSNVDGATIKNIGLTNVYVSGTEYVGGLVGYLSNSTIDNVYVTGTISGSPIDPSSDLGGIVGYTLGGKVYHSYSDIEIINGDSDMGELVGKAQNYTNIIHDYYVDDSTINSTYGNPLTSDEMKQQASFDDWSFDNTWNIFDGQTYPLLASDFEKVSLASLSLEDVTDGNNEAIALSTGFTSDQADYHAKVIASVETIKLETEANDVDSTLAVSINGVTVTKDTSGNTYTLSSIIEGINTVTITVSNPDETYTPTYTVTIVKEDGSATYPHRISSPGQLDAIGTGDYELSDQYVLVNDIDLTDYLAEGGAGYNGGKGWDPIGDFGASFSGTFNGRGHVITNLTIRRNDEDYVGLFGFIENGTIKSVGVLNVDIEGGEYTGGLVGGSYGSVANSYVTGVVNGSDSVGGLMGANLRNVTNSFATGKVTGGLSTGGLVGWSSGNVKNSFATGEVNGGGDLGGLVGENPTANSGDVTNSFWDIDTSGKTSSDGGSGLSTEEMQTKATFSDAGWDFSTVWSMMNGTTYPMLKSDFEAVKLSDLTIGASGSWDQAFSSDQGLYTITLDQYATSVDISATPADSEASVTFNGDSSNTVAVYPGDNIVTVEISGGDGIPKGVYQLTIGVPVPELTDLTVPDNGYYGTGDTLDFKVSYEGEVDVSGTPRLPITIGDETVYADYTGHPDEDQSKLLFVYQVQAGDTDSDGIEIGSEIELPSGATITASENDVSLTIGAQDVSGIKVDAVEPTISLSEVPEAATNGNVAVSVEADGTGSSVSTLEWAKGNRDAGYFGDQGTKIEDDRFTVSENGTYTVYVEDEVGNRIVKTITIDQIVTQGTKITLTSSPVDDTFGNVTVHVTTDVVGSEFGNTLAQLRWMKGSHNAEDFAGGTEGTDIFAEKAFSVAANGTYTVYAKDSVGNEAVQEIVIPNISEAGDSTGLSGALMNAKAQLENHPEGADVGEASKEARTELQAAIDVAQKVADDAAHHTQGELDEATEELEAAVAAFQKAAVKPGDASGLRAVLSNARNQLAEHEEGNEVGEAPKEARAELQAAIEAAQKVVDDAAHHTQEELDEATERLKEAIAVFGEAVQQKPNLSSLVHAQLLRNGHQVTISNEAIAKLANGGTLVVELKGSLDAVSQVSLTKEQVTELKGLNATIKIVKKDTGLTIPMTIFSDNKLFISLERLTEQHLPNAGQAASAIYDFTLQQGNQTISQFDEGIVLTFAVDQNAEGPNECKVFYWNETSGKWEKVGGIYENGDVRVTTHHFSTFGVFDPQVFNSTNDTPDEVQGDQKGDNLGDSNENNNTQTSTEQEPQLVQTSSNLYTWFLFGVILLFVGGLMIGYHSVRSRKSVSDADSGK